MIVKLIQPKMHLRPMDTNLKSRMAPSLGLMVIANILRKDNTVIIENENIEELKYDKKVDLVGITVTVDTFDRAVEIASKYKSLGIPVIAGGIHISSCPDECEKYFDAICVGPSETIWPQIIGDIKENMLQKRYYCQRPINSDDIKSPAYDLIDSSKYLYCNVVFTSYGCPFRCGFCYNSCATYKEIYINKPVAQVVEEIKQIGKKHIMFIDDNFIGNPKWTLEFVRAIRPMSIKWNAAVSANIVDLPELLDEMQLSGCQGLFIGFESLKTDVLSGVNKHHNNIQKYEKLTSEIHKRGMMINASFVFGLDGEDKTVFENTVKWVVKNKIETVTSHILTPYPGTDLYNALLKEKRITSFDYSKYNTSNVVFKPQNMSEHELYKGYLRVYKEIYSFKNIIKRIPKAKKQLIPYLLFNFLYRKFGKLTDYICEKITYERIGTIAAKLSKYI